ncbi:Aspartic protease [Grifola frondosa]|uniref:Aspartic protease n=1 Tax=Grifola frondosa TaxID=5627 RepID=A0A1C7M182_GRIFR|nr:Aspartic protease [Grifola frondosa]
MASFSRRRAQHTKVPARSSPSLTAPGDVSGSLAQDTVSIGSLTVEQQAFGAVRSESTDFQDEPNSGLLGLAFGSIATSKKPTFFENLLAQKKLTSSIFSVHLTRNGKTGSQLCFGCYDATKALGTSTVIWNPLLSRTYWSISMDGLSNPLPRIHLMLNRTAIDTGTTLIYVPDDVAAQFYGLIPGSQSAMQYGAGFYTFPCAGPPIVSLSFNGNPFSVHQSDFNLGRTSADSEDCVGGILAMGSGFPSNLAIIGDEFLKSWYSVYDYGGDRVGFAPSINNE